MGRLAGENDNDGVLPVDVWIILLPDSGVVCSLLFDFCREKIKKEMSYGLVSVNLSRNKEYLFLIENRK